MTRKITGSHTEKVVRTLQHHVTWTCDNCGLESDDRSLFRVIDLTMDAGECANYGFERHYHCGEQWEQLCAIIGADPQDSSKTDFEGDYW